MSKVKVMILPVGTPSHFFVSKYIIEVELNKPFKWGNRFIFKIVQKDGQLQLRTSKFDRPVLGFYIKTIRGIK